MKTITNKIKKIMCVHDPKRVAFFYVSKKEIMKCTKCKKIIEIKH